ncbi:MAG TPA: cupredoxin domain-containing protein, partial [Casimicrobiaceae bacterium]
MNKRKFLGSISLLVLGAVAITGCSPASAPKSGPRVIAIAANRYQFAPSEITLKKGEPVTFRLTSEDMTHGLFVKDLAIDTN